ncbi:hypothetical protein P9186_17085 [Bacillus safensis]|uniref:hypothetical protein n=1 Tax=Bacillus safensis TaxID=561879 RepID=UPI002DB9552F|nr:hypothetical protein [Bacillus safensis]MEC3683832.1 hypothetical protein [Bacillus safensis]
MSLVSLRRKLFYLAVLIPITVMSLIFLSLPANAETSSSHTTTLDDQTYNKISVDIANKALEEAMKDVNKQLEKGVTNALATKKLNIQGDTIELGVGEQEENKVDTQAVRKKNYSGYVKYNGLLGTGFQHKVSGTFTYEKGKIKSNSYDVYLTGSLYGKSHDTNPYKLDKSVWEIRSTGTFTALKYTPFQYTTRLVIGLYGSGDYRVLKAKIN